MNTLATVIIAFICGVLGYFIGAAINNYVIHHRLQNRLAQHNTSTVAQAALSFLDDKLSEDPEWQAIRQLPMLPGPKTREELVQHLIQEHGFERTDHISLGGSIEALYCLHDDVHTDDDGGDIIPHLHRATS